MLFTKTTQRSLLEKKKKKKVLVSPAAITLLLANQECQGKEESSWQKLYQPISTTAWHGKTARHSSHRRSVSWLSLFKWVLCHFSVADSNPFGSQTWLGCLGGGLRWRHKQFQSLKTFSAIILGMFLERLICRVINMVSQSPSLYFSLRDNVLLSDPELFISTEGSEGAVTQKSAHLCKYEGL